MKKMPCRVMVVDDEQAILRLMENILKSHGYDVITAPGFEEALEIIEQENIDLLISDIVMPDGSGLTLGEIAKNRFPNIRLALMTGYHSESYAIKGIRVGADYYLTKPFTREDILDMIESLRETCPGYSKVDIVETRPGWYEFVITSSEDSLFKLQSFLDALLKDVLDEERFWDLHFAISELGRNAIEWGNKYDVDSIVKISVGITNNGVAVKIEDQGDGFDVRKGMEKVEKNTLARLEEERLNEGKRAGGLGIHLIKEIVDRLIFSERGDMALIHFSL